MATPTINEIYNLLIQSFTIQYGDQIPILRKAFLRVISMVLAALYVTLYKYAGFLGLQMFTLYASAEETEINGKLIIPLVERGREFGVGDPKPATAARLKIAITVTTQGGELQAGAQLYSSKNKIIYATDDVTILSESIVYANITAVGDTGNGLGLGSIGNLEVGDELIFVSPYSDVDQNAVVTEILEAAVDAEDINTTYRQRVLDRERNQPQGGALADYRIWGLDADGIAQIYPYRSENPGEIDVYVEAIGTVDGIPSPEQLANVYNAIIYDSEGKATRDPVSKAVNVYPIDRLAFDIIITGLEVDNISVVENAIVTELTLYFSKLEPYIAGISVPPRRDRITKTGVEGIIQSVVDVYGGVFQDATLYYDGGAITDYVLAEGEKAKLGVVTWVS